ncbi:MAG TPA: hypothetical protein VGG89_07650 [Candidatus Baltobacteraceae bacterium]|jgi:hypothetical protein
MINTRAVALLVSFAFLAPCGSPAATAGTPESVVRAFYNWDLSVKYPQSYLDHLSGAKPYLTTSLYGLVSQIGPFEQKNHEEVLDAQPFEDAQIPASSATVGVATVSGNSAKVPVAIRYSRAPGAGHVTVVVIKTAQGWLIDDFVGSVGGSLRANLAHNLK